MMKDTSPDNKRNLGGGVFPLPKKALPGRAENMKVLFYSHDTMGLGHLQRNLKIATILKSVYPRLSISMLTGSTYTAHFDRFPGIDFIRIPPVRKIGKEKYDSFYSEDSFDSVFQKRKTIILESVKNLKPGIFWVDHAPIGMKGELLPALDWISENRSTTLTVLGLRDIIDAPSNIIPLWKEQRIFDTLRSFYDRIFIYGDRTIFDPVKEYDLTPDIIEKTFFTGYIMNIADGFSSGEPDEESSSKKRVFVTIGGGEWAGETVIGNLLEAIRGFKAEIPFDISIVAGPFIPEQLWRRYSDLAAGLPVRLYKFVADIRPYVLSSDLVVSTAGYNTVTDVLGYGKRALFIPRIKFRQEQLLRSRRFAELGIVDMLYPDEVSSDSLIDKITEMTSGNDRPVEEARRKRLINIYGAEFLADYINDMKTAVK
ncbi:MAG: hypothetical protein JSW64_02115 [Candidatus Zixiibacteriota bacterium]|nr:MAG: hypothetical protein JSW64_02115 [candidate division Zixibacteria bacterium]